MKANYILTVIVMGAGWAIKDFSITPIFVSLGVVFFTAWMI